jgi:hypothetical protein
MKLFDEIQQQLQVEIDLARQRQEDALVRAAKADEVIKAAQAARSS